MLTKNKYTRKLVKLFCEVYMSFVLNFIYLRKLVTLGMIGLMLLVFLPKNVMALTSSSSLTSTASALYSTSSATTRSTYRAAAVGGTASSSARMLQAGNETPLILLLAGGMTFMVIGMGMKLNSSKIQ